MNSSRIVLVLLLLAGCGTPPPAASVPVAATPLAGKVAGASWTARGATASAHRAFSDDGGEKWVDISSSTLSCSGFPEAQVIGTIPWNTPAYDLSFSHNLTIVVHETDGGIMNYVAINGRVELYDVTDAGARLRVRAIANADNSVEGEIGLTVCD